MRVIALLLSPLITESRSAARRWLAAGVGIGVIYTAVMMR